jgi:hypothetical protein
MYLNDRTSGILRLTAFLALFALAATAISLAADASTLTWQKLAPTKGLPPRAAFATAYDPISKKVVIFGGFNANGDLNETWTFDGITWSQVKTGAAPSARDAASMAYDQKSRKLVLFGGASGFTLFNDTWLWYGATSTWTQANPKTVPAGASGPILFTDPANGHTDMFGGYQGRFYSRDTFQWTGTDWTLLNPRSLLIREARLSLPWIQSEKTWCCSAEFQTIGSYGILGPGTAPIGPSRLQPINHRHSTSPAVLSIRV